jgi:signal transduction histidine kinase/HAMP domain-containing protein
MPTPASTRATRAAMRWLGFAAVVVPLAILLVLQFRTLAELEQASAAAHRLALKGYARTVLRTTESFYRQKADEALAVPPSLLDPANRSVLGGRFAAAGGEGVKRFFIMSFDAPPRRAFFAPDGKPADAPKDAPEVRAARVAAAPWRLVAQDGTAVESAPLIVDEQDADNRIILRPIVDAASQVRGVAGMVVDAAYFRNHWLPTLMRAEMGLIPEPLREHVVVNVVPRPPGATTTTAGDDIEAPFRFVFTDSMLHVRSASPTPEQWARWSFLTNVALSLLLAAFLLAAVLLALRSAARATKLSQMKSDFVSSVSHELRTPLASIRVFGEFLRLGRVTEPDKVREYGKCIETESRRLTHLVNNLLDFSKIESGQKRYQFERVDVAEIVAETLRTFDVRLKQEGFVVDVHRPPEPLQPVWVDPPAVGQVLTNLIDNAIKYSGDARHIDIELGQHNGFVTVAVSDHGPGIEVEEQKRIFEKFYRVGNGLVHDAKGSGLGLAIVKHIAEAHRGRVVVDSLPGRGSTFTIELPTNAA